MQAVEYAAPSSVAEAVQLLQQGGSKARAMAGGTDLIVQVREFRRDVAVMVDIKNIPEATVLTFDANTGLRVGAATACYRIYEDETVQRLYPALIDSAALIGGIQIQSRASLGGNLCNSSPAADSIPTLIALRGVAHIVGPGGEREVPVEQFCTGPGRNVLEDGEMLLYLQFPTPAPRSGAFYLRFIPRNEMDIAVANCGVSLELDGDGRTIANARISAGAVAPVPLLIEEAGQALAGASATDQATWEPALEAVRNAARPITDMRGSVAQRRHLVGVLAKRAIEGAVERAQARRG